MHLVKSKQVRESLGISPATLSKWVRSGVIPAYRMGTGKRGTYFFDLEEIREAIKARPA